MIMSKGDKRMLTEGQKEEALELYERALLGGASQDTFKRINLGRQVTLRKSSDPVMMAIHEQAQAKITHLFDSWIDTTGLTFEEMQAIWTEARAWKLMVSELLSIENLGNELDKQLGFDDPDWEGNEDE